jgi:hypothetical protein
LTPTATSCRRRRPTKLPLRPPKINIVLGYWRQN